MGYLSQGNQVICMTLSRLIEKGRTSQRGQTLIQAGLADQLVQVQGRILLGTHAVHPT